MALRNKEFWRLVDGQPEKCSLGQWCDWMLDPDNGKVVGRIVVGGMEVSTVFLGLDHNFGTDGPPLLWETMIFGGCLDGKQFRYTTREKAEAGHQTAVALAQAVVPERSAEHGDHKES